MAALNDEQKRFIVHALACYDTPSQIVEAVKEEFNVVVSRPQVQCYDPFKTNGKDLSQKWRDLFEETRKKFLEDASQIPIANQTFRLRTLNRMLQKVEKAGNVVVAAQIIEQASKEVGGMFTNKLKVEQTGANGGPQHLKVDATLTPTDAYLKLIGKA